ncbi:MAG: hypothetical protein ACI9FN_003859 [Saprospiraceae bacterium]|jgi:hypothetical protein
MTEALEVNRTKSWIEKFIIGMNICPFAESPFKASLIRYVLCSETDLIEVLSFIEKEIVIIDRSTSDEIETSLIILPFVNLSFEKFIEFNNVVEDLLAYMGLIDKFQSVAFHPLFRYEGSEENDPSNYTNRSPYPMLHILRQKSIEAVADEEAGRQISEANHKKLQDFSMDELSRIIKSMDD